MSQLPAVKTRPLLVFTTQAWSATRLQHLLQCFSQNKKLPRLVNLPRGGKRILGAFFPVSTPSLPPSLPSNSSPSDCRSTVRCANAVKKPTKLVSNPWAADHKTHTTWPEACGRTPHAGPHYSAAQKQLCSRRIYGKRHVLYMFRLQPIATYCAATTANRRTAGTLCKVVIFVMFPCRFTCNIYAEL